LGGEYWEGGALGEVVALGGRSIGRGSIREYWEGGALGGVVALGGGHWERGAWGW